MQNYVFSGKKNQNVAKILNHLFRRAYFKNIE